MHGDSGMVGSTTSSYDSRRMALFRAPPTSPSAPPAPSPAGEKAISKATQARSPAFTHIERRIVERLAAYNAILSRCADVKPLDRKYPGITAYWPRVKRLRIGSPVVDPGSGLAATVSGITDHCIVLRIGSHKPFVRRSYGKRMWDSFAAHSPPYNGCLAVVSLTTNLTGNRPQRFLARMVGMTRAGVRRWRIHADAPLHARECFVEGASQSGRLRFVGRAQA